jgi:hypothetical protein
MISPRVVDTSTDVIPQKYSDEALMDMMNEICRHVSRRESLSDIKKDRLRVLEIEWDRRQGGDGSTYHHL